MCSPTHSFAILSVLFFFIMIVSCLVLLNSAKVNFFCFIISLIFGGHNNYNRILQFFSCCMFLIEPFLCYLLFLISDDLVYLIYSVPFLCLICCFLFIKSWISPITHFFYLLVFFFYNTLSKKVFKQNLSVYRPDRLFSLNVLFIKIHGIDHFLSLNIFVYVGIYWCTCALIFLIFCCLYSFSLHIISDLSSCLTL